MENALALRTPTAIDPYTPRDLAEAMTLAKTYAASKILGSYGTPEQVMLVMATGAELGISPTAALRGLYVVEGRIYMSADMMVALALRSSVCQRFDLVESTDQVATYEVQRKGGQPTRFSFTAADKAKAGLKNVHDKYPATMLRHRAAAIACRAVFPDVILGMYAPEEQEEIVESRPVVAGDVRPLAPVDAEIVTGWPERFAAAADRMALETLLRDYQVAKDSLPAEVREAAAAAYKARRAGLE